MPFTMLAEAMLLQSIGTLHERMCAAIDPPNLTYNELIELIASEGHRKILIDTPHIVDTQWHNQATTTWFQLDDVKITARYLYTDRRVPFLPRTPVLQPDASPELLERLKAWAYRRREVGLNFGLVNKVFSELHKKCTPAQVRYFWPPILTLCAANRDLQELQEKLAPYKVPPNPPVLGTVLRNACKVTSGVITTASLLPSDIVAKKETQVALSLSMEATEHHGFKVSFS